MALKVIRKGIYFTEDLAEDLRTASYNSRQSESEIVRIALAAYLDSSEPQPDLDDSGEYETDEYQISPEAREAIARLSKDKDVPIPKVIEAVFRKQIVKYFEESDK